MKQEFKRFCPECSGEMIYKGKVFFIKCKELNTICHSCSTLNKFNFTEEEIKNIIKKYINKKISIKDIGKLYNLSSSPIIRVLKDNNTPIRLPNIIGNCKKYNVGGLICTGTYEKFYIEKLISENKKLPKNCKSIKTPYGLYYPDFSNEKDLIEIKCDYTYDILIGKKINRFTKKINTNQYKKIKWVNKNIKPVNILVVDKINNKLIKKEIK